MNATIQASIPASVPAGRAGLLSMLSASLTAAFAAITHAYDFGAPALLAGAIAIALLIALGLGYQRSGSRVALAFYALLNLVLIAGFGIVGGFWNHAVKVAICAVRGGPLPPSAEAWFVSLAHDEAAIDATLKAARETLGAMDR